MLSISPLNKIQQGGADSLQALKMLRERGEISRDLVFKYTTSKQSKLNKKLLKIKLNMTQQPTEDISLTLGVAQKQYKKI